ncbi:MAG: SAM hydrolase/SAM-dependent halogenase family protein [Candidatus Binatia bacterium]
MLITLTTDFGLQDSFAGIMKGVIAGINPAATVVDLTHGIPAQGVMAGALTLRHSIGYFPRGTIHVAIVDPGVGGPRRPLLIECDGSYFIGPDNGLLSLAVGDEKPSFVVQLSEPGYHLQPTGSTFHGRDVFAPVAAHLSLGVPVTAFGHRLETFQQLALPKVARTATERVGEIIYIDSFGNLFTNITEHDLTGLARERFEITLGSIRIAGLASNYATANAGNFVAVINSWGLLEIAVCQGSAQQNGGGKIGDKVKVTLVS